jgi:hypothetical protein
MKNKELSVVNLEYTKEVLDKRNSKILFQDVYVRLFIGEKEVDKCPIKKLFGILSCI